MEYARICIAHTITGGSWLHRLYWHVRLTLGALVQHWRVILRPCRPEQDHPGYPCSAFTRHRRVVLGGRW